MPNIGGFLLAALVGKTCSLIQGKVGGIQVLAGLATSSQKVGCNERKQKSAGHRVNTCL